MKLPSALGIKPPLDPGFRPAALFNREVVEAVRRSRQAVPLVIGVEREGGSISRCESVIRSGVDADGLRYAERIVKFLLWAQGGWRSMSADRRPWASIFDVATPPVANARLTLS